MKKILLLLFLFCFSIDVKAVYFDYNLEKIDNYYITRSNGDNTMSYNLFFIKNNENDDFFYCIEPLTLFNMNEVYEVFDDNNDILNISDELYKKINLISYYGYGYSNHTDIKWYVVTQYLIWKTLYPDIDIYFADSPYGAKINVLEDEINEVEELVLSDIKGINYKDEYEVTTNHEYNLFQNELINNYEIETDIPYEINNNSFIIKPNKKGTYKVKFKRKNNIKTYLYYSSQSQNIIKPGDFDDAFEFEIKVITKNLEVIKKDKDDKSIISGATYGLYDINNNLIDSKITDNNGKIVFKDLPIDTYYIKEIEPSYGYQIDSKNYQITLEKNVYLLVYDKKILKEIKIKKFYRVNDELKNEIDAKFVIYKDNDIVGEYQTDKDGIISVNLPYGQYKIVQLSGLKGFKLADELDIIVDDKSIDEYEIVNEPEENIAITNINVPDTYKINDIYFNIRKFITSYIFKYKKHLI